MGRDFNKELDDLFDQDEQLLTKEVEVVTDADCDVFCDGDRISHLTSGIPSMIRVTRGKHTFVFKAPWGKKRTRTVEIGDSSTRISVTGLMEEPPTTVSPASPQSSSPSKPIHNEPQEPSKKPGGGNLLYWIFGVLCVVLILVLLIISASDHTSSNPTPTSIPAARPTSPASNSNTPQKAPSSASQNSSQTKSQQNNTVKTPSSSSSSSNSTENKSTPAKSNPSVLSLSSTNVSIIVGDNYTLYASGAKVDRWETSNQAVATINQNGVITAHGEGSTTVRAVSGSYSKQCNVTVREFSITPSSLSLKVGEQKALSANASVDKWESDNVKVATVNSRGVVTSVGEGSTSIWAYHGSKLKACRITVPKDISGQTRASASAPSSSFSLSPESKNANVGDKFTISVTGPVYKWESENEKVAKVSNNGVVTCVGAGSTNIWAHHDTGVKRCFVTVSGSSNQSSTSTKPTSPTTITVSSTVKDNKGNILVGASVLVKGTANGTMADINGKFSLRVSSDAEIEVSCVKYKTQIFKASEIPSTITLYKK